MLVLVLALLAAPFAASSGCAAPPQAPALAPSTTVASHDSLRPRGAEAPAPTPQPTPQPTPTRARPTPEPDAPAKATGDRSQPDRVWPLKAGSFTFTQAFGCVHQIANFYAAAPGCPPDRPVFHTGIDLSAPLGTTIYAAAAGWVTHAGPDRDTGLANSQIIIQHWQAAYVREGDYVRAGQPIAEVGSVGYSTGPHLHFGVLDFRTNEWIDPMTWLPNDRSAGGYLGLSPDAKRFPIAARAAPLPDYADPAPPPPPARERVPKHDAKKAAKAAGKHGGKRDRPDKHHKRRQERGQGAAEATATPSGVAATGKGKDRSARSVHAANGKRGEQADPTPTADAGKNDKRGNGGRHRTNNGDTAPPAAPTATSTAPPTGPGTNLPPPVPPVPGVPAPLVPGAPALPPAPTAAPDAGTRPRARHAHHANHRRG
ncbi:MAG TPA: M23 family metallopeptidase [Thermomicrobiales bacterium]|jgi:biotin carboxyl carrier protein|nr:M23 family metallopeptidase [Thermomicrobiales bacterium]